MNEIKGTFKDVVRLFSEMPDTILRYEKNPAQDVQELTKVGYSVIDALSDLTWIEIDGVFYVGRLKALMSFKISKKLLHLEKAQLHVRHILKYIKSLPQDIVQTYYCEIFPELSAINKEIVNLTQIFEKEYTDILTNSNNSDTHNIHNVPKNDVTQQPANEL